MTDLDDNLRYIEIYDDDDDDSDDLVGVYDDI